MWYKSKKAHFKKECFSLSPDTHLAIERNSLSAVVKGHKSSALDCLSLSSHPEWSFRFPLRDKPVWLGGGPSASVQLPTSSVKWSLDVANREMTRERGAVERQLQATATTARCLACLRGQLLCLRARRSLTRFSQDDGWKKKEAFSKSASIRPATIDAGKGFSTGQHGLTSDYRDDMLGDGYIERLSAASQLAGWRPLCCVHTKRVANIARK